MKPSRLRIKFLITFTAIIVLAEAMGTTLAQISSTTEWADLRLQFVYDATEPPIRKRIAPLADGICMPESMMPISEDLIVDYETMGIQNVAFYVHPKDSGLQESDIHPDLRHVPSEPSTLTMRGCAFEPHVVISRVGQKLAIVNADEYGHNPNFVFFANEPESRMQPPGQTIAMTLAKSEKAPSPIRCNIHPWMQAYALVFEHPYSGVSDKKGVVTMEKLPVGQAIHFKIWHESMEKSIDEVSLDSKPAIWPKGNVVLTLAAGINDLGVIKIKPDKFKR